MILLSFFVVTLTICSSWQTDATSKDSSPGLYFVPRPDLSDTNDILIHYKASDEASVRKWTSKIDDFLKEYSLKAPGGTNRMACSWDYPTSVRDLPCDVRVEDYHPCTSNNNYNYPRSEPCVFLALDKLLDWTPKPYNTTEDVPTDMPEYLKEHISMASDREWANAVWVSCDGESPADVEAMGPIQYIPRLGFPSFYFPYSNANQEGYLSPLVTVLFEATDLHPPIEIEIVMMIRVGLLTAILTISSKWQIDAKTTDTTPGLDFVPRPDPADADNTLIYYKAGDEASIMKWTSKIDEFFKQYKWDAPGSRNLMSCSPQLPPAGNKSCDVPLREFEPCVTDNKYNYHRAAPCVFLKLDKLLNWTPDPYTTPEDLPTDLPDALKQHISNVSGKEDANAVWVSCEGENPADMEFIGPVHYIPSRGFPAYYFPYRNQEGYRSPLVAVLFERPMTGIVINISCKAWAKNITRDQYERRGAVHFELMVD